jgi:hypothetical protein
VRVKHELSLDEEVDLCSTESHIIDVVRDDLRSGGRLLQEIRKVVA